MDHTTELENQREQHGFQMARDDVQERIAKAVETRSDRPLSIAEKLENGIDNLDDSLTMINETLHQMAHTLDEIARAQRKPVRYEYRMVKNPYDTNLNAAAAEDYRLVKITALSDEDGAVEYAYMERPIYAEGEEG